MIRDMGRGWLKNPSGAPSPQPTCGPARYPAAAAPAHPSAPQHAVAPQRRPAQPRAGARDAGSAAPTPGRHAAGHSAHRTGRERASHPRTPRIDTLSWRHHTQPRPCAGRYQPQALLDNRTPVLLASSMRHPRGWTPAVVRTCRPHGKKEQPYRHGPSTTEAPQPTNPRLGRFRCAQGGDALPSVVSLSFQCTRMASSSPSLT